MSDLHFLRVSACVPRVTPGDVTTNTLNIIDLANRAAERGSSLAVFPELSVTGYTCGDLFGQSLLLDAAERALGEIAVATAGLQTVIIVGVPVRCGGRLYNCGVAVARGKILCAVPKTWIPNYNEFYERRWFESGADTQSDSIILCGNQIPFGRNLAIRVGEALVGIELCEDLWAPEPPSSALSRRGVTLIANLSASDEVIGKHDYLLSLISAQSARCRCGYVYASAGVGESSTDLVFAGNAIISEDGKLLSVSERFSEQALLQTADIDIEALLNDRRRVNLYDVQPSDLLVIESNIKSSCNSDILRHIDAYPFVPTDAARRESRCEEVINIQTCGLTQRLRASGIKRLAVGISGGLDSTLALLVAVRAFDALNLPRKDIHAITMPGFGTTRRTHTNATEMMRLLGVTSVEIPIGEAVTQHFKDIGQDPETHDVTYENSQARERTQILMDYAGRIGGMVLGTGDLSELALGWCTYNGDHMSMYGVNASVPKTLVRFLVEWIAEGSESELRKVLLDIADTPISPELIPANEDDSIAQKTEDIVGPYELHDFFIYNMLRRGFEPLKIERLAVEAFGGKFDKATVRKWLRIFYRRFFTQQFKRSCMPDGPKTGSICLSPRGDWRMPSDASVRLWIAQLDEADKTENMGR